MSVIDIAKSHFENIGIQSMEVPEWTDEDGKAPRADFNDYGRYITIKATNFTSLSEFVIDLESGGDS